MPYRYDILPKACRCVVCGFVLYNPNKHCIDITCPVCGGTMRRAWDLEAGGVSFV